MEPRDRFALLFGPSAGPVPLDLACALIAACVDPDVDPDAEVRRLDDLAVGVTEDSATGVVAHLVGPLGFRGDEETYHAPENSLLDRVLDRRRGMPIMLAVLAVEVARRRHVDLVGIGLPGHFLVGDGGDPDRFYDLFSGGLVLDADACARLFHRIHGAAAPFDPSYLAPVPTTAVVQRILANLRSSYARLDDRPRTADVAELRTIVPGAGADDFIHLAAARERLGAFDRAADALEAAAGLSGPEPAARLLVEAQQRRARLN